MAKKNTPLTLAIDIGGSGLKMMVLDASGKSVTERTKVETPHPATPSAILQCLWSMLPHHGRFDRVSVGFPGVVLKGVVKTAPNLDHTWEGFDLAKRITTRTKKPVRVTNDADMQGYGDIKGRGVELVVTLGTGMGSALFVDGQLVPNLELGHHPFHKSKTYEDLLGKRGLEHDGKSKWNKHLKQAIKLWAQTFNFDVLYIGGGHATRVKQGLPRNVHITSNLAGLLGGIRLWKDQPR